jgi:hypothetical protein
MQFDAHIQPGVAHFFEQAFMQALTSQLAASADGAKAMDSPKTRIVDKIATEKRRDMDISPK